jgi:hypothetical protein
VTLITLFCLIFHLILIMVGVINPTLCSLPNSRWVTFYYSGGARYNQPLLVPSTNKPYKENEEMSIKKVLLIAAILIAAAFVFTACAGPAGPVGVAGPAGPAGPQGAAGAVPSAADLSCTACHNGTDIISGKLNSWETSVHATGIANQYAGGRSTCAGCHSGGGFGERIAAGETNPDKFTTAYANPSRIDCRACHQIHATYTADDWALKTSAAVPMYAFTGVTFDGGKGNLCANCHQARSAVPAAAADGTIKVDSTHWGAHHGPEAALMLGVGGAGDVAGTPGPHYSQVTDTCVACHMGGDKADHHFAPAVANCVACHADAKNFDMNGAVTAFDGKIADLKAALTKAGLLDDKGGIVVGTYPAAQANALWNYLLLTEDKSHGVHNMPYAEALLDASLAAFSK